jgi:hypothetical protein
MTARTPGTFSKRFIPCLSPEVACTQKPPLMPQRRLLLSDSRPAKVSHKLVP